MNDHWHLGPFTPQDGAVIATDSSALFSCPVSEVDVHWAAKDVFNPGGVVQDGKIYLLVRAEDAVGRYAGTSRIGLATSADGSLRARTRAGDRARRRRWQAWEWPGGCEDPRVVESPDGGYVCALHRVRREDRQPLHRDVGRSSDLGKARSRLRARRPMCAAVASPGPSSPNSRDRAGGGADDGRFWMYWGRACYAAVPKI